MSDTLLRAPAIATSYRLEVIDFAGNIIMDATDRLDVNGSVVSRNSQGEVAGVATFVLRDITGIDPGRHQLRLEMTISDQQDIIPSVTWEMGTWVMTPYAIPLSNRELVSVECYDLTTLLSSHLARSFTAPAGENVQTTVERLLSEHGIFTVGIALGVDIPEISLVVDLPQIDYEMVSTPTWMPVEQLTYIQIANELLTASDHDPLYMERDGRITTYLWQAVETMPSAWSFDITRPGNWISGTSILEPQTEPVPNEWVGICTAQDQIGLCNPVVLRNINPMSPWSIPSQGGRIYRRIVESPVATTANLEINVQRIAQNDYLRARRLRLHCGPLPHLWHNQVVSITIPELDLFDQKGLVREWHMPLNQENQRATYIVDVADAGLDL